MMQLLKFIIIIAVGWFIGTTVVKFFANNKKNSSLEQNIKIDKKEMKNEVLSLNKKLPQRINEFTIFKEIKIKDKNIFYMLAIEDTNFNLEKNKKLAINQEAENLVTICNNRQLKPLIEMNYNLNYVYSDNTGKVLFKHQISNKDCEFLKNMPVSDLGDFLVNLKKKALPIELDEEIMAVDIKRKDNSIIMVFKFNNYTKEEFDIKDIKKLVKHNAKLKNCRTPFVLILFDKGYSVNDIYLDKNDKIVLEHTTTSEMCKN